VAALTSIADFMRMFCGEMGEIKQLLGSIYAAVSPKGDGGNEDLVLQYPESTANLQLAGEERYERETTVNRRLMYLSIDAPEGVVVSILRDNTLWMFASDEIGSMEFKRGVYFGTLKIVVENTTEVVQNWSVRFIFA